MPLSASDFVTMIRQTYREQGKDLSKREPRTQEKKSSKEENGSGFIKALRPVLIVLKVLGVYPAKGLLIGRTRRVELQWSLIPITFLIFILVMIMFIGAFINLYSTIRSIDEIKDIASSVGFTLYYGSGVLDIIFLLVTILGLQKVEVAWKTVERKLQIYGEEKTMVRDAMIALVAITTSCMTDHVLFHMHTINMNHTDVNTAKDFFTLNCRLNAVWIERKFGWKCNNIAIGILVYYASLIVVLMRKG